MKLFLHSLFISFFMTALLFWSMVAFTPASAKSIQPMRVTIQIKHGRVTFQPQPADYYCTANLPCLAIRNNTDHLQIVRYLYTDPTHFRQLNLKPKEIFNFIPKETNMHYVFRIIEHNQVGDELDVQTI